MSEPFDAALAKIEAKKLFKGDGAERKAPTLKDYLASEVTQTRVLIAIKAALDSIGARKRLGSAISNEKAATVLTAVVLEALAPQLPPDGPGGGEEVPSEEVKAA